MFGIDVVQMPPDGLGEVAPYANAVLIGVRYGYLGPTIAFVGVRDQTFEELAVLPLGMEIQPLGVYLTDQLRKSLFAPIDSTDTGVMLGCFL